VRAAEYRGPHDVRIVDVPAPREPADDEVVIRVGIAAICGTDAAEWDHGPVLTKPPVTLGHEFGGVVHEAGASAHVREGRRVVSGAGVWCGHCEWCRRGRTNLCAGYWTLGLSAAGGLAEYVRVPAKTLVAVPDDLSDRSAAIAQPFAVALHALRRSRVAPGESCVVVGVGGIGAFIVAGAHARGVADLIAIDVDDGRLETARALGATRTVNAGGRDLGETVRSVTGSVGPDVIIEASGATHAPAAALASVKKGGRVVLVGLQGAPSQLDLLYATVNEIEILTTLAHVCQSDLPEAVEMLRDASISELTVDRVIPLGDLVEKGLIPLADRSAAGKILVDPWL
jgi:(R,R)-butanediol dehydrogenase / meso-butanediol dehydrogenase / diacetyl reductase